MNEEFEKKISTTKFENKTFFTFRIEGLKLFSTHK